MATINFDEVLKEKSARGQRGKEAEKLVRAELEIMARRRNFDYERLYDARSARGMIGTAQTGDYAIYYRSRAVMLEVKEVDHAYRLPCQNFPLEQRNRMLKRKMAGCMVVLAVYFKPLRLWRFVDVQNLEPITKGSWNFASAGVCNLQVGMQAIIDRIDNNVYERNYDSGTAVAEGRFIGSYDLLKKAVLESKALEKSADRAIAEAAAKAERERKAEEAQAARAAAAARRVEEAEAKIADAKGEALVAAALAEARVEAIKAAVAARIEAEQAAQARAVQAAEAAKVAEAEAAAWAVANARTAAAQAAELEAAQAAAKVKWSPLSKTTP